MPVWADTTLNAVRCWWSRLVCFVAMMILIATAATPLRAEADTGWSATPVASSRASTLDCAQLLFVGVRGSGEQTPYGTTISAFQQQLASQTQKNRPDLSVHQVYLDYPAAALDQLNLDSIEDMVLPNGSASASPYFGSVDAGVSELERLASSESARCPNQKLLVAGFSQGAEVVTRAVASGKLDGSTLGVVLLGNPLHYEGQNVNELDGSASNRAYGLTSALYFLRSQAGSAPASDRQAQVQKLLTTLFSMYAGTVDTSALNSAMSSVGATIPGEDAPHTWSVCMSDDSVCDSSGALSRLLTSTSTVQQERDRTRAPHESYTPANLAKTLDAVQAKIDAQPVQHPATAVAAKHFPLLVVGIGVAVVIVAGAVILGLRRRVARNQTGPTLGQQPASVEFGDALDDEQAAQDDQ